jgi:hypothetical protein
VDGRKGSAHAVGAADSGGRHNSQVVQRQSGDCYEAGVRQSSPLDLACRHGERYAAWTDIGQNYSWPKRLRGTSINAIAASAMGCDLNGAGAQTVTVAGTDVDYSGGIATVTGNVPIRESKFSLAEFYAVEREAGAAVQTNIVGVWIAATTYLIAAFVALGSYDSGQIKLTLPALLLIPFPACALAGYHLLLFGTGVVRSKSIELVERALASESDAALRGKWDRLGSRAETNWFNPDLRPASLIKGSLATIAVQVCAFLVPYISAGILTGTCLSRVHQQHSMGTTAFFGFLAAYALYGIFVAWLGIRTLLRQWASA